MRVIQGAALLLLSSMAILQVQQMVGLPAAPLRSDIDELPYKPCHVVFEPEPWMLDQGTCIQPKQRRVSITKPSTMCKCRFSKVSLSF